MAIAAVGLKMRKSPKTWLNNSLLLVLGLLLCFQPKSSQGDKKMEPKELTETEKRVIVDKGTEQPFSGKFVHHKEKGTYVCKRCGAALFKSKYKFDSNSGWPSFDDAIKGAVKQIPDGDGMRTEIVCAKCSAHLGHAFEGEGFTKKNMRHCVNSISLDFVSDIKEKETQKAVFASGCFWGTQYFLDRAVGVLSTSVGYIGGAVANPTYEQVCTGDTGHAEAVEVTYDPSLTSYETLARLFFETHDPTQVDRQGPDVGEQYRSAIFYLTQEQKNVALRLILELKEKGYDVATELTQASPFYKAEAYHQHYYKNKGGMPYCHMKVERF